MNGAVIFHFLSSAVILRDGSNHSLTIINYNNQYSINVRFRLFLFLVRCVNDMEKQKVQILNDDYTIHRFHFNDQIPKEILVSDFYWVSKTDEELSIVCKSEIIINSKKSDSGWTLLKLIGPFELSVIGILSNITKVLADAEISIFALSTYDTDYLLIKKENYQLAAESLTNNGYELIP